MLSRGCEDGFAQETNLVFIVIATLEHKAAQHQYFVLCFRPPHPKQISKPGPRFNPPNLPYFNLLALEDCQHSAITGQREGRGGEEEKKR